ncbi:thiol reductant ABC exporter subunit CydC [Corynebacterium nuruki]|uniref:thiol reductant ABC exporter subunit CydC n=1 Tax=Corynebacterium nuruki TaxID=1032851 RepID=UPI0039BF395C
MTFRTLTGLRARDLVWPVLSGTVTLLAALSLTVVSAWLITRAWQMPPVMDLTVAVTAVRALGISRAVFRYIDRLASHSLALRCAAQARVTAYRALSLAPTTRTARLGRGDLTSRLTADVDAVADVIVRGIVPALVALVTAVISVGFTALLSPSAALVLTAGLLLAGVAAPWVVSRSVQTSERRRAAAVRDYATEVDRVLTDAPTLRIRGRLDGELDRAAGASRGLTDAAEAGAPADAAGAGLTVLASAATALGVLCVAVTAYPGHSPQWLGVLVLLALSAFEATSALPEAAVAVTRARGAGRRLRDLVGDPDLAAERPERPAMPTGPDVPAVPDVPVAVPELTATHLVYGHDRPLGEIDLDLPAGARKTVTAASGSGKTTLLLTLAGLIPPVSGSVRLDGTDIRELAAADPEQLHRTIAYLPEDAHVFLTTVRDNLAVGAPTASDGQMREVLAAVGLDDWVDGLPEGLSTVLSGGAGSLSGGQRRRLLLARMLLTEAPVLLLDEPFEHLDEAGTTAMEQLFARPDLPGARGVRTVVVVRHPRQRGEVG